MNLNELSGPHQAVVEAMKDQLLIVFLRRLGGRISIPVAEVDDTSGVNLTFRIDADKVFHFEVTNKRKPGLSK